MNLRLSFITTNRHPEDPDNYGSLELAPKIHNHKAGCIID